MSATDLQSENGDLRMLLWQHHCPTPHCMRFGNGGEMYCGGVDFQRDSIDTLSDHVAGRQRVFCRPKFAMK